MSTISRIRTCRAALAGAAMLVLAWPGVAAAQAPTVTFGPVDCGAGGSVATVVNDSGAPARVTLMRDDVVVARMVVPATGLPVTQVVPIAEGQAARVDARYGDSFTSAFVRRDCTGSQAQSAASATVAGGASTQDAPFNAAPVIPATGVRGGAPAAPTPAATPERAAGERATVIDDPISTWPFLLLAAAALLAAGVLASRMPGEVGAPQDRPEGQRDSRRARVRVRR